MKSLMCLHQEHVNDLPTCIREANSLSYEVVVVPIVNPLYYREFTHEPMKSKHLVFSRSDLIMSSTDWLQRVIAVLTDSVDCDSSDYNVRRQSENVLMQEISFAEHLGQQGFLMVKIKSMKCTNLARIVGRSVKGNLIASIPLVDPKTIKQCWRRDKTDDELLNTVVKDEENTWNWWNRFRTALDFNPKIKVALELTSDDIPSDEIIQRWLGEPVEYIIIPSSLFIKNKTNYPVLSKRHQELLIHFISMNVHFIVKANLEDSGLKNYSEYLSFLVSKNKIDDPTQGFDDVLQIPLQPLFDNLDAYTYEVFEKDPVKYKCYQDAIELALIDKVCDSKIESKTVIVMVVGAGRGPLVRAVLNASANTKRKVRIYIIEKNPNAIITLTAIYEELWSDKDIQIYSQDMREFTPPEKVDILVSELLGSFGDNELSPECLDGAQKHLKKDGISIPSKSTSYINPAMTSKIHNLVRQVYTADRFANHSDRQYSIINQAENTYVIYPKNIYHIAKPQALFEFCHPNRDVKIDNTRFKTLHFKASQDCILHGFSGYFDAVLYKDITISIHPETHTKGLCSWFSMYFPIAEPQQLKNGDEIEINFWRCVSNHKVWYEWSITSPFLSRIHNHDAKCCAIYK